MSDTDEYDIANICKNAIVNGIDSTGQAVDPSGTPTYGGTEEGEKFNAENNTGLEAFNVYAFQGEDDWNTFGAPLTPCIIITIEGHPASNEVFGREVKAMTITWWIQIGMSDGWITRNGTLLQESKAMAVWRNRMIDIVENISFSGISIIEEGDTEPMGISKAEGEEDAGDNNVWISGVSKYIEYVEGI